MSQTISPSWPRSALPVVQQSLLFLAEPSLVSPARTAPFAEKPQMTKSRMHTRPHGAGRQLQGLHRLTVVAVLPGPVPRPLRLG